MTSILLALALMIPQSDDVPTLEKKISEREARRKPIERQIREAVDRGDDAEARKLNQEFKDNEKDLDVLKNRLAELQETHGSRWVDNLRFQGEGLLTRWDNALGLDDGFGWGASLLLGRHLTLEYQRWETRDNINRAGATVQSYELGLRREFGVPLEGSVTFIPQLGVGLMHFSSDASRSDSGPVVSLRADFRYYFNARASFSLGGDFDFVWTDFNGTHTHGLETQSFLFSIELAF
jgi:hypothetical protein